MLKWLFTANLQCLLVQKPKHYADILITTSLQYPSYAEAKTERPSTPDALMMSAGATPLSNN